MKNRTDVGFLINVPAKGGHGVKEALKLQAGLASKFIPESLAEDFAIKLTNSQCYFGPSPAVMFADGTEVVVHVLGVPATSTALIDPTHPLCGMAAKRLLDAPQWLHDVTPNKISVLGLGAATAIAQGHGRRVYEQAQKLKRPIDIVTTGNTITAGLAVEIAARAFREKHGETTVSSLAVMGGFGSVGSRVVSLSVERFNPRYVVITTGQPGRDYTEDLRKLSRRFQGTKFILGDLRSAVGCQLSFLATSSVSALPIDPHWLPKDAVMIDIGKPLNTEAELAKARPDVTILDGSLAQLPRGSFWQNHCRRMKLPENAVFGCLAETIYLGYEVANGRLQEHFGKTTFIGRPDGEMAHQMIQGILKTGIEPFVTPAHWA